MKHRTMILALLAASLITFTLACEKTGGGSETPSPTATSTPTAEPLKSANFVDATSSGDIDYALKGIGSGDSTKMSLELKNKTERIWEVKIEVGTKLEPNKGNIQQMVVTKEVEVHLEPHEEETLELEVGCLEISKEAPSTSDTGWHLESSRSLAQFIKCANSAIDYLKGEGEATEEDRSGLLQGALWTVRGATHDDWVEFYEKYQHATPEEAEQAIQEDESLLKTITTRCPSP